MSPLTVISDLKRSLVKELINDSYSLTILSVQDLNLYLIMPIIGADHHLYGPEPSMMT